MKRKSYTLPAGIALALGAVGMVSTLSYGESKLNTRSLLMTKLMKAEKTVIFENATTDSLQISRSKIKALKQLGEKKALTDVFVTLETEMSAEELESLGMQNVTMLGTVAVGQVDIENIEKLEANENVISISLSGASRLHCDMARADTGTDAVRAGEYGLPRGYDGSGVVVSLFDQGVEPGHINFMTADRKDTRVKRIWHYRAEENAEGERYTVETSYVTPEAVKSFVTDDETQTHGTHTMGILTGTFGVTKEDPQYDYSGFAPGADIAIGCGSLSYANVIRAINNFKEYADGENKPLVVNLSFGDNIGPHDGTDAFPKALNALAETVPVFMSAGNEAKTNIALHKTFTEEDSDVKTVISPMQRIKTYLGVSWEAACEVQIWSEDNTRFTVHTGLWDRWTGEWVFELPTAGDGLASYIANGAYAAISDYENDDFDFLYQDSAIGISTGLDPNNQRYTADIWYMLNKQTNHIDRNIVPVLIVEGEPGKRIDIYSDGDYNEFDTAHIEGWDKGQADGTISNIACGKNTIAVGSYCTRDVTGDATVGEVSTFSSWGILPDGRTLPDVLAPGECLVSSMSTPFTASDYYYETAYPAVYGVMLGEDNPFYWTVMSGTSQASPAMAGMAALWLQANPNLTPAEIKEIINETSRPTTNMTAQCGAGKADALEGLKKSLELSGVKGITESNNPSPISIINRNGEIAIENLLGEKFKVSIYDLTGCLISTMQSDGERITIDNNHLNSRGVYVIKIDTSNGTITKRFLI